MNLFTRESGKVKTDSSEVYEHGSGAGFANFLAEHGSIRYNAG